MASIRFHSCGFEIEDSVNSIFQSKNGFLFTLLNGMEMYSQKNKPKGIKCLNRSSG